MLKSKGKFVALSGTLFGGVLFAGFVVYGLIDDRPLSVHVVIVTGIICAVGGWAWAELMWHTLMTRLKQIQQKKDQPKSDAK